MAKSADDVWMLSDTDTVFQCSAEEIRARFDAFGVPLVVGTEHWLFPRPDGARGPRDPFERACATDGLRYPNSGLLMGTRRGLDRLVRQMRADRGFPCCSFLDDPKECFVDDQACMQSALLKMALATWPDHKRGGGGGNRTRPRAMKRRRVCAPRPSLSHDRERAVRDGSSRFGGAPVPSTFEATRQQPGNGSATGVSSGSGPIASYDVVHHNAGAVDYALDTRANLFLNMFMVYPRELSINARGQIVYTKTGTAPCVIHTNAYKSPDLLRDLLPRWTHVTWVPSERSKLQRHFLRQQRSLQWSNRTSSLTTAAGG